MVKVIKNKDLYKYLVSLNSRVEYLTSIDSVYEKNWRKMANRIKRKTQRNLIRSRANFTGNLLKSIQTRKTGERFITKRIRRRIKIEYSVIMNAPYASWIEERIPYKQVVRLDERMQRWYEFQTIEYGLDIDLRRIPWGGFRTYYMAKHGYRGVRALGRALKSERRKIHKSVNKITKDKISKLFGKHILRRY